MTVSSKSHRGRNRKKGEVQGMEGKLIGNDLRLISGLYLEDRMKLIGKFEIAVVM